MSKQDKFISYFTSVITIGVVGEAEPSADLNREAMNLIGGDGALNCSYYDQSEFEFLGTEPWNPEFEAKQNMGYDGIDFHFEPSKRTKRVIGLMLKKDPSGLTTDDYEVFVKQAIQSSLHSKNLV